MSLSVFAFCQIMMDLEVLGRLLVGAPQIHGFTNTALGATVILVPSVLLGRPVCQVFLRWWNSQLNLVQARWTCCALNVSRSFLLLGSKPAARILSFRYPGSTPRSYSSRSVLPEPAHWSTSATSGTHHSRCRVAQSPSPRPN